MGSVISRHSITRAGAFCVSHTSVFTSEFSQWLCNFLSRQYTYQNTSRPSINRPHKRKASEDPPDQCPSKKIFGRSAQRQFILVTLPHLKRKAADHGEQRPSKRVEIAIPPKTFSDLPVEIIQMIGEYADDKTLYLLTAVSRFLFAALTSIYLRRNDLRITAGEESVFRITKLQQFTALHVWRRSSFFERVRRVLLHMSSERLIADAQARRLCAFFDSCNSTIFTSFLSIYLPYNYVEASMSVLQCVSGCEDLSISFFDGPSTLPLANVPDISAKRISLNNTRAVQFKALRMDVSLLTKDFKRWTITILNTTDLTKLDLLSLCRSLSPKQWQQLLRQIHIPTLKIFHVPSDAPLASIAALISKHVHIKTLYIGDAAVPTRKTNLKMPVELSLPNLTQLTGLANMIELLIQRLEPPPPLFTISILPDHDGLTFESINNLLHHPICGRIGHLSISLPADAAASTFRFDARSASFPEVRTNLKCLTLSSHMLDFALNTPILDGCLQFISLFSHLSLITVLDGESLDGREGSIAKFAQSVRQLCRYPTFELSYNFTRY